MRLHRAEDTNTYEGSNEGVLGINLGIKEVKSLLTEIKRQQFIKMLQAGYLFPENIMDEYDLWQSIKK
ncbi:MAG: hypothetical protein ABIK56_00860 [candidate division WOR-3 bacterium]